MAERKSFVYLVRTDGSEPQLLVFDSLDELGLEVPKGAVEAGETFVEAAVRELREEAGITDVCVVRELGVTWYEVEEQRFFLVEAPAGLQDTFEHTVTGNGGDRGFRYGFRWLSVDSSLQRKLVQGSGAFAKALVDAVSPK